MNDVEVVEFDAQGNPVGVSFQGRHVRNLQPDPEKSDRPGYRRVILTLDLNADNGRLRTYNAYTAEHPVQTKT